MAVGRARRVEARSGSLPVSHGATGRSARSVLETVYGSIQTRDRGGCVSVRRVAGLLDMSVETLTALCSTRTEPGS